MEKALEQALDRAECVIESIWQRLRKREESSGGGKSLPEKLYDLYVEECGKEPGVTEELISNVNLLEKLVQKESLSHLVVNLYPGKQGYSLMLKGPSEPHSETIQLPYEEKTFLEYLDAEKLPPALVDLLEKSELNMFHSGCVIAEVRDYRQGGNAGPLGYQSRHVLLRPTMQTLACDVQSITSDNQEQTQEDKLESQLILATAEPLCLDPSESVACTANRLLHNRQEMNTTTMRRNLKRYSTASPNEPQEPSCSPELHEKSKASPAAEQNDLKMVIAGPKAGNCVDIWKQRPCDLAVPSEVDVEKYAREERSVKYDDSPLTDWPTYGVNDDISLFGYEAGDQSQTTKLTFMKSLNDPFISGIESAPKKARCGRPMSPRHSFREDHCYSLMPESSIDTGELESLFEELEPLSPECTFEVSQGSSSSAPLSQLSVQKEPAQPLALAVQPSVPREGVRYTPLPISLLSSSGKSFSGNNSLTPQQASRIRLLKMPSPVPASKPPSLPQKPSVEANHVSTLPAATLCAGSSAETIPASHVKAESAGSNTVKVEGPVPEAQIVVRRSNPGRASVARARAPEPVKISGLPSRDQSPNMQPTVPQALSQGGVQHNLRDFSRFRPIGVLWVPEGVDIWKTQQPQQLFCQLFPVPQLQQPPTMLQQRMLQGSSAQGSASQQTALSAQQAAVMNRNEVRSVLQPQTVVQSQPASAQTAPGQSRPKHVVQLSSAFPQQPQPQQVRLRVLPSPVAAAPQIAQQGGRQQVAGQGKGEQNGGLPRPPKS
ncbi:SPT20-like protein, SAGA complex component [Phyllostomus discolor]|uniref:SPT20-like protein, SAGA complex component n=1 Tax=Phyllostomus discolor TaxID=89673 RepID=A0A7E6D0F6_9CHIR|nr:transcription factor SPT20 homolog [Phyllostomus discolor]KAF6091573.1 SPT20-like protein, SAGA complex component [Phyllostomus discolor]